MNQENYDREDDGLAKKEDDDRRRRSKNCIWQMTPTKITDGHGSDDEESAHPSC